MKTTSNRETITSAANRATGGRASRIGTQDIVRTAQQLRDEQNAQLRVRPWSRQRRFHIPAWLVAVPAAAIAGFVLGIWTNAGNQQEAPLTAFTDTVYIKVPERVATPDTTAHADMLPQVPATSTHVAAPTLPKHHRPATPGRSIADDKIRYDLLVKD